MKPVAALALICMIIVVSILLKNFFLYLSFAILNPLKNKIINTLRSNGILMANIVPDGSLLRGSSSVVQLDAWNWEDAALKTDQGIHLTMPSLMPRPRFGGRSGGGPNAGQQEPDPVKEGFEKK